MGGGKGRRAPDSPAGRGRRRWPTRPATRAPAAGGAGTGRTVGRRNEGTRRIRGRSAAGNRAGGATLQKGARPLSRRTGGGAAAAIRKRVTPPSEERAVAAGNPSERLRPAAALRRAFLACSGRRHPRRGGAGAGGASGVGEDREDPLPSVVTGRRRRPGRVAPALQTATEEITPGHPGEPVVGASGAVGTTAAPGGGIRLRARMAGERIDVVGLAHRLAVAPELRLADRRLDVVDRAVAVQVVAPRPARRRDGRPNDTIAHLDAPRCPASDAAPAAPPFGRRLYGRPCPRQAAGAAPGRHPSGAWGGGRPPARTARPAAAARQPGSSRAKRGTSRPSTRTVPANIAAGRTHKPRSPYSWR